MHLGSVCGARRTLLPTTLACGGSGGGRGHEMRYDGGACVGLRHAQPRLAGSQRCVRAPVIAQQPRSSLGLFPGVYGEPPMMIVEQPCRHGSAERLRSPARARVRACVCVQLAKELEAFEQQTLLRCHTGGGRSFRVFTERDEDELLTPAQQCVTHHVIPPPPPWPRGLIPPRPCCEPGESSRRRRRRRSSSRVAVAMHPPAQLRSFARGC
jgi:hypothetical protein